MADIIFEKIDFNLLRKEKWKSSDFASFYQTERWLKGDKKSCDFESKIVNTSFECFGKTSYKAKAFYREIKKGNYISFLRGIENRNHFESILYAYLVSEISDFGLFRDFLYKYLERVDNWASCDALTFLGKDNAKLLELSDNLLKSDGVFYRRVGLRIYFELIKNNFYIDYAFKTIDGLKDEKEYYVNMCAAWLLCECFVKNREKTLDYLKKAKTNDFIINKAIDKCRDSFRVVSEDKALLLSFKKR